MFDNKSWMIRKAIYVAVAVVGLIMIATGKADTAQVDSWLTHAGNVAAVLVGGLAAANTKNPDREAGFVEDVRDIAREAATLAVNSIVSQAQLRVEHRHNAGGASMEDYIQRKGE